MRDRTTDRGPIAHLHVGRLQDALAHEVEPGRLGELGIGGQAPIEALPSAA